MRALKDLLAGAASLILGVALATLMILILLSDCGPDGYGQQACLDDWGEALAAVVRR